MSYKTITKGSDQSALYLKLKPGENRIRIVSEAIPVWTEFDRANKKATKYLDEEIAHDHPDAKERYAFWAIDRTDGKTKMAEMPKSIMRQIQTLANDTDYAFDTIPSYDMKIIKTGDGMETRYTVTPAPASELTTAEKTMVVGLENVLAFMKKQPGVVLTRDVIPF